MTMIRAPFRNLNRSILRFCRGRDGAILVEFGLVMPLMLLLLMVMFESGRMVRNHQLAIAGVRDASRYLARIAPVDICITGGSVTGYTTQLTNIVTQDITGTGLFPGYVTVNSVTPSIACIPGTYRVDPAPIATVTANLSIEFPFSGIMSYFGSSLPTVTTTVTDQAKVFGQ